MSCVKNKRKYDCGTRTMASCVFYEDDLPEESSLKKEDCVSVEETITELYEWVDKIKESIDTSKIDSDCIDFDNTTGKIYELLNSLSKEVCELKGVKVDEGDINTISIEGIDTKCLTPVCGDKIGSLKDLLQAIINKICA